MTTIHLQVAPRVGPSVPRGSRYAALVFITLWRALAELGRSAPSPVKSPAQEAQAVRELAWTYRETDPGFAADLQAAADHHEQLHGAD